MQVETKFDIGQRVFIDDDRSMMGTVTAINIRGFVPNILCEVSYVHCGVSYTPWIEQWRLSAWDA